MRWVLPCCVFFCFAFVTGLNIGSEEVVTLREWPYESWLYGPPCPPRHQQKLVPINGDDIQGAIEEVRLLTKLTVDSLNDVGLVSGFSVGIVYDQQVLLSEGFGTVNIKTNTPPADSTIFNIGSVTKIFTSLAFFHSVEKELVRLTDPVTKFFNENNPPVFSIHNPYSSEGSDAVTLHSLAAQASGLPREPYCGIYPLTEYCSNYTIAAEQNLAHLSNFGLLFSPFSGSHYSNLGLSLLGRCLERAWNTQYEEYMVHNVFPAIGMNSTGFTYTQEVINNMATGYVARGPLQNGSYVLIPAVPTNTQEWDWAAPCGGAYTNRRDLNSFLTWVFSQHNNDSFLSQSFLDEYLAPGMLMANAIEMFGQGTWETFYANRYWTLTKGGLASSMAASITIVPELKLGVHVMINIDSGVHADALSAEINEIMVPALLEALGKVQTSQPLPSNYQMLLGSYGYNSNSPYVTMEQPGTNNGILSGQVIGLGQVRFIWDPTQDTPVYTAFRYSSTESYGSCMSLSGANNALVYFRLIDNKPHATLNDQNLNFYNIPMLSVAE